MGEGERTYWEREGTVKINVMCLHDLEVTQTSQEGNTLLSGQNSMVELTSTIVLLKKTDHHPVYVPEVPTSLPGHVGMLHLISTFFAQEGCNSFLLAAGKVGPKCF